MRKPLASALAVVVVTAVALFAVPTAFAWDFANQQIADKANSFAIGSWGGSCKNFATGMVVDPVLAANGHPALQGYGAPGGCYYGAYENGGGVLVDKNSAAPGDLVQAIARGHEHEDFPPDAGLHTAIVIGVYGPGDYEVAESNYGTANTVGHRRWDLNNSGSYFSGSAIYVWRFGSTVGKYATHIVAGKDDTKNPKTSWYVSNDLRRLYIPDQSTYDLLKAAGAAVSDSLTKAELDQLPDQKNHWAAAGNRMSPHRTLRRGMSLVSPNGLQRLIVQRDGNLVLCGPDGAVRFSAACNTIDYLVFQSDGNLVGYDEGPGDTQTAVWSTNTAGKNAVALYLRNNGTFAILDKNDRELWSSVDPARYRNYVVTWNGDAKKTKTAWYVTSDLRRLYVPDAATRAAFKRAGAKGPTALPANVLDALPDQKDHWAAAGNAMTIYRTLRRGMSLCSANGRYRLSLDGEGDLQITDKAGAVLWDAEISGIDSFCFEKGGNLVGRRNDGSVIWATGTGSRARRLVLRNDGIAAVFDVNGKWLWSTKPSLFPICTVYGPKCFPAISDNVVVWKHQRNGDANFEISGYDLHTCVEFPISSHVEYLARPAIYGSVVVWNDVRSGDYDIYGYDLATKTEFPICTATGWQMYPAICRNVVVWWDERNGDCDIYGYDLASKREFPICTARGDQTNPGISGNIVVWGDWRNGDCNIYGYDLASKREFPICTAARSQSWPAISGNIVVWSDERNGDGDIYGYDLASKREFPVCTVGGFQSCPAICGNIVVWEDDRNSNSDIYGIRLS